MVHPLSTLRHSSRIARTTVIRPLALTFSVVSLLMCAPRSHAVPVEGRKIMIAGPSPLAVDVGTKIAQRGGNVVDVAVAVGLTLAVTNPYFAAFGGGGFAMIKMDHAVQVLDFRETAPRKAKPEMYLDKSENASTVGGLAIGVPGVPAGLWAMHQKYGKLKWAQLFAGPLELAQKGFRVSGEWVENTVSSKDNFNNAGLEIFFKERIQKIVSLPGASTKPAHGSVTPLQPGDILKQPRLARFLKLYRAKGPSAFYQGPVARDVVDSINAAGGIFTLDDLNGYQVRWLEPITAPFAGYTLYLMPPPSSGGIVIAQAVHLIEKLQVHRKTQPLSVDEFHLLAEIMKLSYRGRSLLGDPAFAKNPVDQLTSEAYLNGLAKLIKPKRSIEVGPLKTISFENAETTHFSVMDGSGNAVALTVTLNGDYGAGVVSSRYGIALNNEMDDFTTRPGKPNMFDLVQGEANQVRAGARPLSSMSPTIVEKDGKTALAIGSPGGPRIISGILQVVYRALAQKFDIDQAIQAPRIHHQFLPDKLFVDALKFSPEILDALRERGHDVTVADWMGKVYGVQLRENGILAGAYDSRGEGGAGGF